MDFSDTEKWTPVAYEDFMDLAKSCEDGEIRQNNSDGSIALFLNDTLMAATVVDAKGDRLCYVK